MIAGEREDRELLEPEQRRDPKKSANCAVYQSWMSPRAIQLYVMIQLPRVAKNDFEKKGSVTN